MPRSWHLSSFKLTHYIYPFSNSSTHHSHITHTHKSRQVSISYQQSRMKGKLFQVSLNKCKKMGSKMKHSSKYECESCCKWCFGPYLSLQQEGEKFIPKDVPKGHMVVYVGQDQNRYVIKITLLKHPLFRSLLDQARDHHDDSSTPHRLWIPCHEDVFLHVLRCLR